MTDQEINIALAKAADPTLCDDYAMAMLDAVDERMSDSDRPQRSCQTANPQTLPGRVTLADVLDALNVFNKPKPPCENDGPWEAGHFIRVDYLPAFINIIAEAIRARSEP